MKRALLLVSACSLSIAGALGACSSDDDKKAAEAADAAATDATTSDGGNTDSAATDSSATDSAATDSALADSAADGALDAEVTAINVALVYAGLFNGIDQRLPVAFLQGSGAISGYNAGPPEELTVTTATIDGVYGDSFSGASRWTNGNVEGHLYDDGGSKAIPLYDGQHLGIAKVPSITLPASGTASYALVASTRPTYWNGTIADGTISAAALSAAFGGNAGTRISYSFTITMPDGVFVISANGGAANIGDAGGTAGGDAGYRFTGHTLAVATDAGACGAGADPCPTGGATRVVFSGPNAERIVMAYTLNAGSIATNRRGVLVFQKQ